ncbi:Vacuolar H+-ATPase V0 sector, subunits c/c' [Handroanthus impetiginosus]|uniref:Vacuolar H+-ATPase V0 sector, subunits c/c n=1 Tax=Handroanthus impetiginosus TaxID=429701 RepID=A0A2G9I2C1_9LAMI|nr:Vacuolar H+-ATPase V0 sector, subunits c/c' [Handroanthus impetiginosus]
MSSTFSRNDIAPFFGFLGAVFPLVFFCLGVAYGMTKSGVSVALIGVIDWSCVLGIYRLIIAINIRISINPKAKSYYLFDGYANLSSRLTCGLAALLLVWPSVVGDTNVRANAQQLKLFVGMILILIFTKALALHSLIVGIILSSRVDFCSFQLSNKNRNYVAPVSMVLWPWECV